MARSRSKSTKRSKIRKSRVKKYSRSKQRYRRKRTRARGKPKKQQEGGMKKLRRRPRKSGPPLLPITSAPRPITSAHRPFTIGRTEIDRGMVVQAVEYIGEGGDFLVSFIYSGKAYSITGSDLIEFCKLADPDAEPEELTEYNEKYKDYESYVQLFRRVQEKFMGIEKPDRIQELKKVPSMIKAILAFQETQGELEDMEIEMLDVISIEQYGADFKTLSDVHKENVIKIDNKRKMKIMLGRLFREILPDMHIDNKKIFLDYAEELVPNQ